MATRKQQQGGVTFEEVKTFLLTATPKQRADVIALLGASGTDAVEKEEGSTTARVLYEEAARVVEKVTSGAPVPYEVALRSMRSEIMIATRAVETFLVPKHTGLDKVTQQERVFFYHMLMTWVASYLRDLGIPLTPRTLLQGARNVGTAVDHALPGYAAAGLLPRVFDRLRQKL